jgi:hypothetical protein
VKPIGILGAGDKSSTMHMGTSFLWGLVLCAGCLHIA